MSQMIDLNIQFYTDPETGLPIANGLVYVGVAGTDPTQLANQIPIFLRQEDGTEVATAQPVTLSGGAIPEYQGSPAQIMTNATDYATAVHDHNDAQVYYVSTVLISESAQNAAKTAADVVLTNADVVTTKADVVLTNADVVQTGLDAAAAAQSAAEAAASALLPAPSVVDTGVGAETLKFKVVTFSGWDMDTVPTFNVNVGVSAPNVRKVQVRILGTPALYYDIGACDASGVCAGFWSQAVASQIIVLNRTATGLFDSGAYAAASGEVNIEYSV